MEDVDNLQQLFRIPVEQNAWYFQIKEEIARSKRPIDKMSTEEIVQLYRERGFLCDVCGKKLQNPNKISLEEHILHLINPILEWTCEDCYQSDLKNGRIIAAEEEKTEEWQERSI